MKNIALTCRYYIELALIVSTAIFAFFAFSSLSIYWVQAPYDAWRIYEIFILLILSTFFIFYRGRSLSIFPIRSRHWMNNGLILLTVLIILSCYFAQHTQRAIADASLYFLLAVSVLTQAIIFKKHPLWTANTAGWLAVLPMLSLIFLPIALFDIWNERPGTWTQSFTNIRMLDDALLPCLFLLWMRPAWLAPNPARSTLFNLIISSAVFIISTIYLLSFLFHGARAGLLSIVIALATLMIGRLISWKMLKLPSLSLVAAFSFFYWFTVQSIQPVGGSTITRTGSSGRVELWQKAFHLWTEHPIWGIGGNNFSFYSPNLISAHPHNIFIQWLVEWGIAGLLAFGLLLPVAYIFLKNYKKIHPFILAAIIALVINAMLSGSLIYPVSQLLSLYPLAWALAQLSDHISTTPSIFNPRIKPNFNFLLKSIIFIAMVSSLVVHIQDLACLNCISIDGYGAPRFWDAGRALHLTPFDDLERVVKLPTEY